MNGRKVAPGRIVGSQLTLVLGLGSRTGRGRRLLRNGDPCRAQSEVVGPETTRNRKTIAPDDGAATRIPSLT